MNEPIETCPDADRLRAWFESGEALGEAETAHIGRCSRCQEVLDAATDHFATLAGESATKRIGRGIGKASSSHHGFTSEPEFQALKGKLASLGSKDASTLLSGAKSGGTKIYPNQELINDQSYNLLNHLERQLPGSRYKLRKVLGRGAGGVVVLAFDSQTGADVAIKFLASSHPDAERRFQREAEVLRRLRHPNVVRMLDFGICEAAATGSATNKPAATHPTQQYLVMEYLSGGTAIVFQRHTNPNLKHIAELMIGAAEGLQAAHDLGLIHRDIKPSNLLLDVVSSSIKVGDFGLVTSLHQGDTVLTRSGDILGTPQFMSPEHVFASEEQQDVKEGLTSRSDIYSFGATLYALLTGQPPVRGSLPSVLRQIVENDPPKPTLFNAKLPRELETICLKCMEKDPQDRYASMQLVADDLRRFRDSEPLFARPPSSFKLARRWARRNPWLAASVSGIAILLMTLTLVSTVAAISFRNQQNRLIAQRDANLNELSKKIAVADPRALTLAIDQLADRQAAVLGNLQRAWKETTERRAKINLAIALTLLGDDRREFLLTQVVQGSTEPGHSELLFQAFATSRVASLSLIQEQCQHLENLGSGEQKENTSQSSSPQEMACAKLAILCLRLGDASKFSAWSRSSPDRQTHLAHQLPDWFGAASDWLRCLEQEKDAEVLFVLWSGIGLLETQDLLGENRAKLKELAARHWSDNGVQSAATWAANRLLVRDEDTTGTAAANAPGAMGVAGDYVSDPQALAQSPLGFRLIPVPAGSFEMGNRFQQNMFESRQLHPVTITREFLLADREISRGLFELFAATQAGESSTNDTDSGEADGDWDADWSADTVISPTTMHPVQQVTWFEAIQFCNWLSQQHGYQPCYRRGEADLEIPGTQDNQSNELVTWIGPAWSLDPAADGYRLPTEAEFEYTCRAGTTTLYSFGNQTTYFSDYSSWSNNTRVACSPIGQLMPNRWGFFDMHGNVWEWVGDWYQSYDSAEPATDPFFKEPNRYGRTYRGGGICTYTGYPDSSSRGSTLPDRFFNNVGFRVARNAK